MRTLTAIASIALGALSGASTSLVVATFAMTADFADRRAASRLSLAFVAGGAVLGGIGKYLVLRMRHLPRR